MLSSILQHSGFFGFFLIFLWQKKIHVATDYNGHNPSCEVASHWFLGSTVTATETIIFNHGCFSSCAFVVD